MQLSLVQFSAVAAGGLVAFGRRGEDTPRPAEGDELKPIELDISGDDERTGAAGIIHNAAEFLIISITGCEPKR